MVRRYYRPIISEQEGLPLAGGPFCFARAEVLTRAGSEGLIPAEAVPADWLERLTRPRPLLARPGGGSLPLVMGILNVTPDSFSDGGRHEDPGRAVAAARAMRAAGAAIIDVGAESTRPGARELAVADELARLQAIMPALAGLNWSIDTRKAGVMQAALAAGAGLVNDVSALCHDPAALALVAQAGVPVVLMHHQGTPETMQQAPHYGHVLLDVFDWLEGRIAAVVAGGVAADAIIADPGIGFGKGLAHNRALLQGLALLHGLGVPILLGASRKSLIGKLSADEPVERRLPGSLALALAGANAGVQMIRVHDVPETVQALTLWAAAHPCLG
ncbi:MAG: dihydropteroate synthase [Alphaproteobacteria bacterium]|nr:dihydropteroate synthase [Alphaproteobacteria bacterium]